MKNDVPDNIFGLNALQVKQAKEKYALLEPLLDKDMPSVEWKRLAEDACVKLNISARTLRRYLHELRRRDMRALARKSRMDSGIYRSFSDLVLKKALALLNENDTRTVPLLLKLMETDETLAPIVRQISPSTLYHHLHKAGWNFKKRRDISGREAYHKFEAEYANQLWQGDARHGIPLPNPLLPGKSKMTYCFAWIDDFSRKLLAAFYYWDEQLPRMEDCFRQAVLRWGLPEKLYCDNGAVYISDNFDFVVSSLGIRKIHHPAYSAWCKGKIEAAMKTILRFQQEARCAGFKTIEELNASFAAWIDVEYNNKIHSSTGETPVNRFRNSINAHPPRRVNDLDQFNSIFLWRETRTINKYGAIQFLNNLYSVHGIAIGESVEIRFNPFDLSEIRLFLNGQFLCKPRALKLNTRAVKNIPEEKNNTNVSEASVLYFKKIRQLHLDNLKLDADNIRFSNIKKENDNAEQN